MPTPDDNHDVTHPGTAGVSPLHLIPASPEAPAQRSRLGGRLWARWRIYALWYVMVCVAASAFWAQAHGGRISLVPRSFGYLIVCSFALTAPGRIVASTGLSLRAQRSLMLGLLTVAAALVAGTMSASMLWATSPFILLAGNAIWSIEEIDRRLEGKKRK